jgi:multicomponent Na+:H+ antiporter subunit F
MIPDGSDVLDLSVTIALIMLSIALVLALVRLVLGPTLPDRIIAVDLTAFLSVGIIATYSISTRESSLLDAALVLALIVFLGTVVFARYLERGASQ